MAIVRRRTKAEIPDEVKATRDNLQSSDKNPSTETSLECYRERCLSSEDIDATLKDPSYYSKKLRAAGIRPRKKKVLGDITYGEVEEAIWHSEGQYSNIARRLHCSVEHVKGILKRNKLLNMEFREFRERITDEVEGCLLTKIRNGDTVATLFYLKCHAKERGYIEKVENVALRRGVKMRVVKASTARKKTIAKMKSNIVPFAQRAALDVT